MLENERGKIYNPERAKQLIDFSGIRIFENITPTNLDGFLEIRGKCYIIFEYKLVGYDLPIGQRKAIERVVDDLWRGGKPSIAIIAEHNVLDCNEQIDGANSTVREIRYKGDWRYPQQQITAKSTVNVFLKDNFITQ